MLPINRPVQDRHDRRRDDPRPALNEDTYSVQLIDESSASCRCSSATSRRWTLAKDVADAIGRQSDCARTRSPTSSRICCRCEVCNEAGTAPTSACLALLAGARLAAPLRARRAGHAATVCCARRREPQNWLTYNGTYTSQRYSTLDRITPANVARLESKWVVQNQVFGAWQSNPLVVDGVMYLDAASQRRDGRRREDRIALLALSPHTVGRGARSAAAPTTAAWRCSATRSSWARSTPGSSPSTR